MNFRIFKDDLDRWAVKLEDCPEHLKALPPAPAEMEDYLKVGRWVVMSFAVWSGPDHDTARRAIKFFAREVRQLSFGLRPLDVLEETLAWVPQLNRARKVSPVFSLAEGGKRPVAIHGPWNATPVTVAILDGDIAAIRFGLLTDSDFKLLVGELF